MRPDTVSAFHIANVERDPRRLKPWQTNARLHSRKQLRQLGASIRRFGFTNPAIIDEVDNILAGHGRVLAAIEAGLEHVPCRMMAGLSEAEKRALVIADNKLALNATWDEAVLAAEIRIIQQDVVVPVEVLGFDPVELDILAEATAPAERGGTSEDDELPTLSEVPVTEAGDIWLCGDHKIICGNSLEEATFAALLGYEKAEMVVGDFPYNVPIRGHVSGLGKIRHREFAMASGEMDAASFTSFLNAAFVLLAQHSTEGSIHFYFMDWRHLTEITTAAASVFSELKNLIVWDKGSAGMGSFYRSRHELIFLYKNGSAPHINNFGLGQHGRHRSNVWQYRGLAGAGRNRQSELALHPTVKPVQMIADAMLDCSRRGGIVLDPFGGSASSMIAAEKTRRRARLIEIDAIYVDRSVRRWQTFAKDDAVHAVTGETFNACELRKASESGGEAGDE